MAQNGPRVVAVANSKGGSAKTTTAVSIAAALANEGRHVLLIDCDPQASASRWLGGAGEGSRLTDVYSGRATLAEIIEPSNVAGLDLAASSPALASVAAEDVAALATAVRGLAGYDVVLIDTPPTLDTLAVSGLLAARWVLVPVDCSGLTLDVLGGLLEIIETIDRKGDGLTVVGFLACRVDTRQSLTRDIIARMMDAFGERMMNVTIREAVRLREAATVRQPISIFDPRAGATADYRLAALELWRRTAKGAGDGTA